MNKPASYRPRSTSKRRKENTALGWLGHDTQGAGVLATARIHLQVQRLIATALPPALASVCQVAKLEKTSLQLAVPSPSHAAKLRQLAPTIVRTLAASGWNLETITVKVQANLPKSGAKSARPPKEAMPLGHTALDAFKTLHDNLRPGPLAEAIARLLAHHKDPS